MGGWRSGFDDEWGMGPAYGMMGAYGGMMPGMGYAMPGYPMAPWPVSDLTPEQSEKIGKLQNELAERNRAAMRQILETRARLNSLYAASERRDWNAIRSAHRRLLDLQRQLSESAIDFQQEAEALLTDAQRREAARAWRSDDE